VGSERDCDRIWSLLKVKMKVKVKIMTSEELPINVVLNSVTIAVALTWARPANEEFPQWI
jgi:hypothetical protein